MCICDLSIKGLNHLDSYTLFYDCVYMTWRPCYHVDRILECIIFLSDYPLSCRTTGLCFFSCNDTVCPWWRVL